jgi:DMSO/TMAO reductase YedYZ heme-binding membrane subunit
MSFKMLIPFAIFGYLWFLLTLLSGLKVIKVNYKTHRIFGIVAVILATLHAVVMIYLNYWS